MTEVKLPGYGSTKECLNSEWFCERIEARSIIEPIFIIVSSCLLISTPCGRAGRGVRVPVLTGGAAADANAV